MEMTDFKELTENKERTAYECASRDLDECLTTEAMRQSFKD